MVYYDGGCVLGLCEVAFSKEAFATRNPVSIRKATAKNIYGDPVDVSKMRIMTKSAYLAMKNEKGGI